MKAVIQKAVLLLWGAVLAVSLGGCGNEKMEAYNEGIVTAVTAINEAAADYSEAINDFRGSYSEENRQAVLDAVEKMDGAYQMLGGLDAPDRYAEVQALFRESAELFSKAAEIYGQQFGTVTAETVDEAFVENLREGDDYRAQAQEKMMEGAKKGQEIDSAR